MGKITEFSIQFTSSQVIYYPGQQVTGYVTLDLKEPMDMRGLRLKFCGKGYSHWSERHGPGDNRRTVHYTGKKAIIKEIRCLFGSLPVEGADKCTHPQGKICYPFSFRLPMNIPSSFEGTIGHIRYILKATLDRPWKFDYKVKRPFVVNDLIDTNSPLYVVTAFSEYQQVVGCFFCKVGPIEMSASINRTCYCPGETIHINAFVQNQSTRDMQSLHAKLIQIVRYKANNRDKSRTITKEVARLNGPAVPKDTSVKWENQPFGVPATPPSILNCSVVSVRYELKVIVGVPRGMDASVNMDIIIGTLPYMRTYGKPVVYGTPEDKQEAPDVCFQGGKTYTPFQPGGFGYPQMPPPSYSAPLDGVDVNIAKDKDEHTFGELSYCPVYTFAKPYEGK